MKYFFNNILNPKQKQRNWFNNNYFYATTLFMIGVLCLCFFVFKSQIDAIVRENIKLNVLFEWLGHADIGHILGNLISFVVVSVFLERHFGSIKYLGIILLGVIPTSLATFAISGGWRWIGYSGINYYLYAMMFIVMIFNFKDYFIGKFRWIFLVIMIGLIILIMSWAGKTQSFSEFFRFSFVKDFYTNIGHWSSFIIGIIMGLFANLYHFDIKKKKGSN